MKWTAGVRLQVDGFYLLNTGFDLYFFSLANVND